jgi:hypothetical protein
MKLADKFLLFLVSLVAIEALIMISLTFSGFILAILQKIS